MLHWQLGTRCPHGQPTKCRWLQNHGVLIEHCSVCRSHSCSCSPHRLATPPPAVPHPSSPRTSALGGFEGGPGTRTPKKTLTSTLRYTALQVPPRRCVILPPDDLQQINRCSTKLSQLAPACDTHWAKAPQATTTIPSNCQTAPPPWPLQAAESSRKEILSEKHHPQGLVGPPSTSPLPPAPRDHTALHALHGPAPGLGAQGFHQAC